VGVAQLRNRSLKNKYNLDVSPSVCLPNRKKNGALKSSARANTTFSEMYETKANERQTESKEPQFISCLYTRGISTVLFAERKPVVFFMTAEAQVTADSPG
jgi:hypothetical protein